MASQDDIFESFWGSEEKEKEVKPQNPKKELKENWSQHLLYSLEYFLSVNNPILGLLFFMNLKDKVDINEHSKSEHLYIMKKSSIKNLKK